MQYLRAGGMVVGGWVWLFCLAARLCVEAASADKPDKVWERELKVARQAFRQRAFAQAEQHYLAAVQAAESFGAKDRRLADSLLEVGVFYTDTEKRPRAEPLYQRALSLRESTVGTNQLEVAYLLTLLGELWFMDGRPVQSEAAYWRAFKIVEFVNGANDPTTAVCLHGLAKACQAQGRMAEAEKYFQSALIRSEARPMKELRLTNAGVFVLERTPFVRDTAGILNDFALLRKAQGQLTEAEKLLKKSLNAYGKANPNGQSIVMNNQATLYLLQTNHFAAQKTLAEELALEVKAGGWRHPRTWVTGHRLLLLHLERQEEDAAAKLWTKMMAGVGGNPATPPPTYEVVCHQLFEYYLKRGRLEDAEDLGQCLFLSWSQTGATNGLKVARLLNQLAESHLEQGRKHQALSAYQRSLLLQEKALGLESIHICSSLKALREIYAGLKQYAEAELLCRRQAMVMEKAFGALDSRVGDCLEDHAGLLRKLGRLAEAQALEPRIQATRTLR